MTNKFQKTIIKSQTNSKDKNQTQSRFRILEIRACNLFVFCYLRFVISCYLLPKQYPCFPGEHSEGIEYSFHFDPPGAL
jgi:hypothetical protein